MQHSTQRYLRTCVKCTATIITMFDMLCFIVAGLVGYTIWKFYIKRDVKNNVAFRPEHSVLAEPLIEAADETSDDNDETSQNHNLRSNNNNGVIHRGKTKNGTATGI